MAINVEISKNSNENVTTMLRRFTKKVQSSGILPRIRSIRYSQRELSPYKVKQKTLKVLRRRAEVAELIKLGKISEKTPRTK